MTNKEQAIINRIAAAHKRTPFVTPHKARLVFSETETTTAYSPTNVSLNAFYRDIQRKILKGNLSCHIVRQEQ